LRKIYDEYLYVPEQGEGVVREKVFFSRLVLSIACMVVCMIAMGYNAYAFFTANVESTSNVLQAATYEFVKPSETEDKIIVVVGDKGSVRAEDTDWKYTLNAGTYDFTFIKSPTSTATTGYARINILQGASGQQFYTEQIGGVYDAEKKEITSRTIRIKVETETTIQIDECWGTYSGNVTTPIAEEVIVENQKMIEVNGTNISSVAWAEPQITNKLNAVSPASTTDSQTQPAAEPQTPAGGEEIKDEGNSSQTQEDSQNTNNDDAEETPSAGQQTTE